MRHSVSFFIGNEFDSIVNDTLAYALKYGDTLFSPYFKLFSVSQNKNGLLQFAQNQHNIDTQPIDFSNDEDGNQRLQSFFKNLTQQTITIANPGSHNVLHLLFYLQLYNQEAITHFEMIYEALSVLNINFDIDVVAIFPDVTALDCDKDINTTERNNNAKKSLQTLHELTQLPNSKIAHIIVIQDTNNKRFALNFTKETISAVIGELTLLCIENYDTLFPINVFGCDSHKIASLGLSVVRFDKFYFAQYLLGKAYLNLLDKEQVNNDFVSPNKCNNISSGIIKPYNKILSKFINGFCSDPNGTVIIDKDSIDKKLDGFIKQLQADLQAFIYDKKLSLPEKQVIQANILGEDDSLVTDNAYNDQQLSYDDIIDEPFSFFVKENDSNIQVLTEPDKEDNSDPIVGVLNDSNTKIGSLLPQLKSFKEKICNSTQYIRNLSNQLTQIQEVQQQATNVNRRLTKDGYVFDGVVRRLLHITETPLEETYSKHSVSDKSIDLRNCFSPVKNQGTQGSCSAFAIASIYEYILNKNSKDTIDLSEAFLYYNARKKAGDVTVDDGASLFNTIGAISDFGICTQDLCQYDENVFNEQPSNDAYSDGLTRVVKKALNVNVSLEDFKSALADGYPIAIGLKLFDSFGDTVGGFVRMPSTNEISSSKDDISHAMVVCGYSDDQKIFVVRNSWGTKFGDNGYCYIPYSYITNPELCNNACIITDVGPAVTVAGIGNKVAVSFNQMNDDINRGIALTLIAEETLEIEMSTNKYHELRTFYISLLQKLQNQNLRDSLLEYSKKRIAKELDNVRENEARVKNSRQARLDILKNNRHHTLLLPIAMVGVCVVLYFLYPYSSKIILIAGLVTNLTLLSVFLWRLHNYKNEKQQIKEEFERALEPINSRRQTLEDRSKRIKEEFYLAGLLLDNLVAINSQLVAKYNSMQAYIGNLKVWYKEESENVGKLVPPNKEPVISLATNAELDLYFENHYNEIIDGLYLHDCFVGNNKIDETTIKQFNDNIRNSIRNKLNSISNDFDMYEYVSGKKHFNYLSQAGVGADNILQRLNNMAMPFFYYNKGEMPHNEIVTVFISLDTNEITRWEAQCRRNFSNTPNSVPIKTADKIIVTQVLPLEFEHIQIV